MNRRERRAAGKRAKTDQSVRAAPAPAALYETGLQHLRAGRHLDAQIACQQALTIDPGHADSLHLMGLLALRAQQYDHAVAWLSRAIRQNPRSDYLSTLGITLKQMGRLDDALSVFDKAVQLKPDDAELWKHFGGVLAALGRPAEALLSLSARPATRPPPLGGGLSERRSPASVRTVRGGAFAIRLVPRVTAGPCRDAPDARAGAARLETI